MTERDPGGRRDEEVRAEDEEAFDAQVPVEDDDTDVILDVPVLNVEELTLEVQELKAHISARAELAGFLSISVGVDAYVDEVKLNIKGVQAQVQLKVKLERILGSIDRALAAIEKNPRLIDPEYQENRDAPRREENRREISAAEVPEDPARDGSEPQATDAAMKKAEELGLDLSKVEGTGSGGRIVVRDVVKAARD